MFGFCNDLEYWGHQHLHEQVKLSRDSHHAKCNNYAETVPEKMPTLELLPIQKQARLYDWWPTTWWKLLLLPRDEKWLFLLSMRSKTIVLPNNEKSIDTTTLWGNMAFFLFSFFSSFHPASQKWGTGDAEIKDPSVENPEFKGSPFQVS